MLSGSMAATFLLNHVERQRSDSPRVEFRDFTHENQEAWNINGMFQNKIVVLITQVEKYCPKCE